MSASIIQPLNNNSSLGAFNNSAAAAAETGIGVTAATKIPMLNSGGPDQTSTSILQTGKGNVIKRDSIIFKVGANNAGENIN